MPLRTAAELNGKRCSLLLGVPIEFAEFVACVGTSDWLAKFRQDGVDAKADALALRHWWDVEYRPLVADPLQDLIACAHELGVNLIRQAKIADLAAATANSDLVILFAHWKGYEIVFDDLVRPTDQAEFMRRANEDASPLGRRLRRRLGLLSKAGARGKNLLGLHWRNPFAPSPPTTLLEVLSEALEAELDEEVPCGIVDGNFESRLGRLSRRRAELDQLFRGLIQPGNRVELFDGLHSQEAIERAVSGTFDGWLDLTTCSSSVLSDHLLRSRHNAFRMVQFEKAQEFLWHAHCVRTALRLCRDLELDYPEARLIACSTLESAVDEADNENRDTQ